MRTSSPDSLLTAHQRDCAHASPNARTCASEKAFARATARSTRSSTLVGAPVSGAHEGVPTASPNPKKRDPPVGVRASSVNESARETAERSLSVSPPHSPTDARAAGLGGVPCDPTNRRAIAARSELDAGGGPFTASACECARNHASSSGTGTHDHPPELRVFFFVCSCVAETERKEKSSVVETENRATETETVFFLVSTVAKTAHAQTPHETKPSRPASAEARQHRKGKSDADWRVASHAP